MPPRRRLTPEQRRDALLDVGEELLRERGIDEVSMQDIATAAGVTRALLYHYFGTKSELFGGIWSRAHLRLGAGATSPSPTSPSPPVPDDPTVRGAVERLLRDYLEFYAANLPLVVIANRSSISSDPAVRRPIDAAFDALCGAFLDATGASGRARTAAEVGFAGWIAFVRETSLATYLDGRITHEENADLCMAAFDAAVGRYVDLTAPAPR